MENLCNTEMDVILVEKRFCCVSLFQSSTLLMDCCPFYILGTENYVLPMQPYFDLAINGIYNITCRFRVSFLYPNRIRRMNRSATCAAISYADNLSP